MPASLDNAHLELAPAVAAAVQAGEPVVALESTLISHGMPYPTNIETALEAEATVRQHGAVAATIAVLDGRLKVGITAAEIEHLGKQGERVTKASRRELPFVINRKQAGATTVASTLYIAAMAGIRVLATGGIGGVHRGVGKTLDISADLEQLAQTDVAVVCAGIKSILDIGCTLEYLETKGVPVVGFRTDAMPAFFARESGFSVDDRMDTAAELALAMKTKWALGLHGSIVIANPIPPEHALDPGEMNHVIDEAIAEMQTLAISGKAVTPFLLARVAERTEGRSLTANVALLLSNAAVAAQVAVAFAQLDTR